ncbi:hypothetical protein FFF34_016510 [Inquilinus sp. KBS0705]|nr:hypothetical protein FFF34_016510 [Inquilinus sp. KBS0705]
MKKILSILCVAVIALTASSCKKETIVAPNNNQTILTSVASSGWTSTDGGKTFSAVIDMPEIDSYFNDNGGVLVYLSFTDGVWEQVPEVYNGTTYSYTHNPGKLVLYAQAYDAGVAIPRPDGAQVKIVLIESNQ